MTDIAFDRLRDVSLREAWAHEAHAFTPWLAQNIDHISQAIGVPLELTGTEVAVGPFSADILACNPQDDSVVLIENQLEPTDHTHLGQIMTYLAGLEARTVVWIAPHFREPHLSAIRWLNQHTADGFSFFALRLRVVRIGESPFAPIFEVVEKPSNWDRRLDEVRRDVSSGPSEIGTQRRAYWTAFHDRYPDAPVDVSGLSYMSLQPDGVAGVSICVWIGLGEGGIFVRGDYGEDRSLIGRRLEPVMDRLRDALGDTRDARSGILGKSTRAGGLRDPASWPALMDWQRAELDRYRSAFTDILGQPS